jgi:LemA protein
MRNIARARSCFLLLGLAIFFIAGCGYNQLQGLDEQVKAAWAEVQNQYQRRADLIPNLVATVKGASQFEQETLQKVIEARAQATSIKLDAQALSNPETFKKFEQAQQNLSGALSRLMVVVKRYVEAVAEYNKGVRYFPTNLTAKYLLGLDVRQTFTAEEGAAKPPQVKF